MASHDWLKNFQALGNSSNLPEDTLMLLTKDSSSLARVEDGSCSTLEAEHHNYSVASVKTITLDALDLQGTTVFRSDPDNFARSPAMAAIGE